MRDDLTYIAIVLDASSSMGSVRKETIQGLNAFVEEQKNAPGSALLTLASFADETVYLSHAKDLNEFPEVTETTYRPFGNTALYDAIGGTIDKVGATLAAMKEEDRPGKVIFLIMTDGEENRSRRFSRSKIARMIKHQQNVYSWDFVFIGANQDAIANAAELNISEQDAALYTSDSQGTSHILRTASANMAGYRGLSPKSVRNGFFAANP